MSSTLKVDILQDSGGNNIIASDGSGNLTTQKILYPAFEAYLSSSQSISSSTDTKVQIDTELFDTDNCYDNSTNYRFTPTVAGKYFVYANIQLYGNGDIEVARTKIYKNGSEYKSAIIDPVNTSLSMNAANVINTAIIDMNGSSDYLEVFGLIQSDGTTTFQSSTKSTYFGAYRIGD